MDLVIEARNLTKTYMMGEFEVRALRDVSFTITRAEMFAFMGHTGAGKTTMMNTNG